MPLNESPLPGSSVIPDPRRSLLIACTAGAAAFVLYALTRSAGLVEIDSVQFALGVRDFNLFVHTPHPPGYPLYIFAGWALTHLARLDAEQALRWVSTISGGVYVGAWTYLFARQFGLAIGALTGATLGLIAATWLTSTQVLTDIPAAAPFALQLALAREYARGRRPAMLIGAVIFGAVAIGVRPQFFAIVAVAMAATLIRPRSSRKLWAWAFGALILACLLWLIPTLWTQSRTPEADGSWLAYPSQVMNQWRWRFDKPAVFMFGEGNTPRMFAARTRTHITGVFYAFGLRATSAPGAAGALFLALGVGFYLYRGLWRAPAHREFWARHLPWAIVHIIIIYVTLPGHRRYYCPVYPLLLVPVIAGWWSLPGKMRWSALGVPVLMAALSLPLALRSHRKVNPPMRAVQFLCERHPPDERDRVMFISHGIRRHVQFYAPKFPTLISGREEVLRADLQGDFIAVYTDDDLAIENNGWANARLEVEEIFEWSPVIHEKHSRIILFRVEFDEP